ncbi:MAG: DUF4170 domain-containing protein [Rhodovulum sp.]|nr:DUF4170 domain-containing protein [Rhodovulum sp.]
MTQRLHLAVWRRADRISGAPNSATQNIDVVGIFPELRQAYGAWKAVAQASVDHAETRYFIAHLHRWSDEEEAAGPTEELARPAGRRGPSRIVRLLLGLYPRCRPAPARSRGRLLRRQAAGKEDPAGSDRAHGAGLAGERPEGRSSVPCCQRRRSRVASRTGPAAGRRAPGSDLASSPRW